MLCLVHVRNLYYHCRHLYPLLVVVSIDLILIDLLIDCLDHLGSHLVDPFEGNNGEKNVKNLYGITVLRFTVTLQIY